MNAPIEPRPTPPPEPDELDRQFADVVGPLRRLGETLRAETYPGRAWAPPARNVADRRRGQPGLLVALAAAATLLLAAGAAYRAGWLFGPDRPTVQIARPGPAAPAAPAPAAAAANANDATTRPVEVPRIDPSIAAYVTWRMPRVTLPSTRDANGTAWSVPPMRIPAFFSRTQRKAPRTRSTTRPQST